MCMQTVSRELEEEALQKEADVEKQMKALAAAAAVKDRKHAEELNAKDAQIAELQVYTFDCTHQNCITLHCYKWSLVCSIWRQCSFDVYSLEGIDSPSDLHCLGSDWSSLFA